jgi:uncharacterized protein
MTTAPDIRQILTDVKTIALVGASANQMRPSYGVMAYLLRKGYQVYPVNPGLAGQDLQGQKVYAKLSDIPVSIDMIDVFRNSEAALDVTNEALSLPVLPQVIWMQLGVQNDVAAALATAAGVKVVMDRCPKIEYEKLFT